MLNRNRSIIALSLLCAATLSGCVINVGGNGDYHDGGDVSSVLGSVTIYEGRHAGDVSSVNGDVTLQTFTVAEDVSTVNGNISIADNAAINDASTVNGDINAGKNLNVFGDMATVNGNIGLSVNSLVEGDLETVNGDITVPDGEIKGSVTTQNGDVSLSGNTRIYGDIVFEETENGWMKNTSEQPVLSITDDVVVNGNIILERAVVLELANPALESKVIRRNNSNRS